VYKRNYYQTAMFRVVNSVVYSEIGWRPKSTRRTCWSVS